MYKTASQEECIDVIVAAHFLFKPGTDQEQQAFRHKWIAEGRIQKQNEEKAIRQVVRSAQGDTAPTQLITISINKDCDAVSSQKAVIDVIRQAKYSCLDNVSYSFEYYSSNGWNPHIHIKTDKSKADSQVAQLFRRKLDKKNNVYYINVSSKTEEIHSAYIMGNKKAEKSDDCKKDEEYRKIHNLQDIYIM